MTYIPKHLKDSPESKLTRSLLKAGLVLCLVVVLLCVFYIYNLFNSVSATPTPQVNAATSTNHLSDTKVPTVTTGCLTMPAPAWYPKETTDTFRLWEISNSGEQLKAFCSTDKKDIAATLSSNVKELASSLGPKTTASKPFPLTLTTSQAHAAVLENGTSSVKAQVVVLEENSNKCVFTLVAAKNHFNVYQQELERILQSVQCG